MLSIAHPKFIVAAPTLWLILKNSSRVFDPLGYVAPVVLPAKLLLKTIRQNGYEWDKGLSETLQNQWYRIYSDLEKLSSLKLQRYAPVNDSTTLHVFSSASGIGNGFAVYQRTELQNEIVVQLIFAKARVNPSGKQNGNQMSIPNLELLAAALATAH